MTNEALRMRADFILDNPYADPDRDAAVMARAYLRATADLDRAVELEVERIAENLTRWMMGEGLIKVNRWMMVGWRDTMFDEGVALWTEALRSAEEVH